MSEKEAITSYGVLVLIVLSFAGFLFGYHVAIVSGALIFLTSAFSLSTSAEGFFVAVMLLGGLGGALIAGPMADHLGRKKSLACAVLLFIIGSWCIVGAIDYTSLLWGRVMSGLAAGIVTVISPMSLAEIAPPAYRGRCVSLFQFMIALGILLAYGISFIFAHAQVWQPPFKVGILLSVVQFAALFALPETPAWLLTQGKRNQAESVWRKVRADTQWQKELEQITPLKEKHNRWQLCFKSYFFKILCIGVALNLFQQITGINAVIYYTPRIFKELGIDSSFGMFLATLVVGLINVLATVFSAWILDKVGRKRLLLVGSAGMTLSLTLLSTLFLKRNSINDAIACFSLISYVAFFAMSLGPVTWVVLSEIFPLSIRGSGMAIAIACNWLANYVVALTFPDLIQRFGVSIVFALFGSLYLLAFLFIYRFIPETKGKTLEEIETMVKLRKKV